MTNCDGIKISFKSTLRPCMVYEKEALFHQWFTHSQVVPPSNLAGGHAGGQMSTLLALVEFENGTMHAVPSYRVKFLDTPWKMAEFDGCFELRDKVFTPNGGEVKQEPINKKDYPYTVIKESIRCIKQNASRRQYDYAEGMFKMAIIAKAITQEQIEELSAYLESMKGYCYRDQEAEHLVQRIHRGVIHTIGEVPVLMPGEKAVRAKISNAVEAFFKNFKEEEFK